MGTMNTNDAPEKWLALLRRGGLEDIEALSDRVRASSSLQAREALALALPTSLDSLSAEASLALSMLAMDLTSHDLTLPDDVSTCPARIRVAWQRVRLCAGDELAGLDDAALLAIVHGWEMERLAEPEAILRRMGASDDPRLRAELLGRITPMLDQTRVCPEVAFELLISVAQDDHATLRRRAVRLLPLCHFAGLRPAVLGARARLLSAAVRDDDPSVAIAAIEVMQELALADSIRAALVDDATPPHLLSQLLEALGPFSVAADLDLAFRLLRTHPIAFAFRAFLRRSHRHGVFVRVDHLGELLSFFDQTESMSPEELAMLAYIHRESFVALIASTEPRDPRWRRRAGLLAVLHGTDAHLVLADALKKTDDLRVAEALLDAAAKSDAFDDESALLSWLPRLPETTLRALSVKGDTLTRAALLRWVIDPLRERSHRQTAIDVLLRITSDREGLLVQLATALGPIESQFVRAGRACVDATTTLLVTKPWPDSRDAPIDPAIRWEVLSRGGRAHYDDVVSCFREIFASHVDEAIAGDFSAKRIKIPALEQKLYAYGQRLVRDGYLVRTFATAEPETGTDVLLSVVVGWLRERPSAPITVALLESLARHAPRGPSLHAILPFYRRKNATVARAAMEAILASGESGRGLELSICRIAGAPKVDPRVLERALLTVAAFEARWAEPMAREGLEHASMSVKKAAASALAVVANPVSIERLVFWLGRHDNPGLRTRLMSALQCAAGTATASVLIRAIEEASEARAVGLLHDALSGVLTLAHALILAERGGPTYDAIVDEALAGRIALKDAKAEELAGRLHRRALRVASKTKDDPARSLRLFGFSKEEAETLIAKADDDASVNVLPLIGRQLASWLSWMSAHPPARVHVRYVAEAANREHAALFDRLFEVFSLAEEHLPLGSLIVFLGKVRERPSFSSAHRRRAVALLRALPPREDASEVDRFRMLAHLGAVRSADDLKRGLEGARRSPTYVQDAETLLCEALQVPPRRSPEPAEVTELRFAAEGWASAEEAQRKRWLDDALRARPLDLPIVADIAIVPGKKRPSPDRLRQQLWSDDARERVEAAGALLRSSRADAKRDVLEAYLDGRVQLANESLRQLAGALDAWPKENARRARAAALAGHFSEAQRALWIRQWAEGCLAGEPVATGLVRGSRRGLVHAHVLSELENGTRTALHLLSPDGSIAQRELVARYQEKEPYLVSHLVVTPLEPPDAFCDPLEGLDQAGLAELIASRASTVGVAVRALHALASEDTLSLFEGFAVDSRGSVRSAALRLLRQHGDRERSLRATLAALAVETRKDVIVRLMRSLAHARYQPALPSLLSLLMSRDPLTRKGARAALLVWGPSGIRDIERARRRARPDRRPAIDAVLEELRNK